jgi:hypothetical protein
MQIDNSSLLRCHKEECSESTPSDFNSGDRHQMRSDLNDVRKKAFYRYVGNRLVWH